jgi:hypothetical protein
LPGTRSLSKEIGGRSAAGANAFSLADDARAKAKIAAPRKKGRLNEQAAQV